ncbi:hypothetical protein EWH99_10685 [Sporolactobacillus sp. THM7-7]|nr:hypothetical protein EWH99_10685 [Sporolactobacillus sp. THM7-7]
MPWIKRGGMLPDDYGLSVTVFASEATAEAPIKAGTPLKFSTEAPYTVVKCADGDKVQLVAKHDVRSPEEPLGAYLIGFSRNHVLPYSGTLAVGDSVVADANGGVKKSVDGGGAAVANGTFVAQINDNQTCEFFA